MISWTPSNVLPPLAKPFRKGQKVRPRKIRVLAGPRRDDDEWLVLEGLPRPRRGACWRIVGSAKTSPAALKRMQDLPLGPGRAILRLDANVAIVGPRGEKV